MLGLSIGFGQSKTNTVTVNSSAFVANSPPREWTPHIWEGCDFFAWLRLMAKGRCAVSPSISYVAAIATQVSFSHSVLKLIEQAFYRHRIVNAPIAHDPIFILGHWRSGTTLLHELLICDQRHSFPSTYHCLEPNHPLLTENLVKRTMPWLLPSRRPMDNMAAGWERPQEDEFAMCMLGQPSPYLHIAFPNQPPMDQNYLDLSGLTPRQLRSWKQTFYRYLQLISHIRGGRRLVLKSPPHTCRIPVLLELFPRAKFIHIMRDPFVVFPSTVNLWRSLYEVHGLQVPNFRGVDEYVLSTFERFYGCFERDRHLIPDNQYFELRYEDLVLDPMANLAAIYEQLDLGQFEQARPIVDEYLSGVQNYETNRYTLTDDERRTVAERWGAVSRRFGYEITSPRAQPLPANTGAAN